MQMLMLRAIFLEIFKLQSYCSICCVGCPFDVLGDDHMAWHVDGIDEFVIQIKTKTCMDPSCESYSLLLGAQLGWSVYNLLQPLS